MLDVRARENLPENLVRRFNVLPLRMTDSYLEVATANPFDIDAEKMLAFATGREVRMLLASPSKIRERAEMLYGGADEAVHKILGGLEDADVSSSRTSRPTSPPRRKRRAPRRSSGWWT